FFQAEGGIRAYKVTGVQTCALPISKPAARLSNRKTNRFVFLLLSLAAGFASAVDVVRIDVLSNRADLISGGDALVAVAIPAGARSEERRVGKEWRARGEEVVSGTRS